MFVAQILLHCIQSSSNSKQQQAAAAAAVALVEMQDHRAIDYGSLDGSASHLEHDSSSSKSACYGIVGGITWPDGTMAQSV